MITAIEKLLKFLQLEIKRQYDNQSVIGGLEKIQSTWKQEALFQGVPFEKVSSICETISNYSSFSIEERQNAVTKIFNIIQEIKPDSYDQTQNPDHKILNSTNNIKSVDELNKIPNEKPYIEKFNIEKALSNSIMNVNGIGKSKAESLAKLGIFTIKDLIYYFPKKHEDFSNLKPVNQLVFGEIVSITGIVKNIHTRNIRGGKHNITEIIIEDGSGSIRLTYFNQPFLEKSIKQGKKLIVSGKVEVYLGRFVMNNPEWIELDQGGVNPNRLFPYYSLTKNITQKWLRGIISNQINLWIPKISDFFSNEFLEKADVLDLPTALNNIHFPASIQLKRKAEERFSFQDTFFLHLVMLHQKQEWQKATAKKIPIEKEFLANLIQKLPFSLTTAQKLCITDICTDLGSGTSMSRLIQGDVGSGKTIVAALIIAGVIKNDFQSAVMAPTGILAEQLFRNIKNFLLDNKMINEDEICFLTGDTPDKQKKIIKESLANGKIKIAVGTHALLEDPIQFNNLEFVVIDEQHRFGVNQRKKIRSKGNTSHLLVMTATPIPRTLALTIYGDLDLSIIDEIPPGRMETKTSIVSPNKRNDAYNLIRKQANDGFQAFIVYPLVESEDIETTETNAAVNEYNRLKSKVFPDLNVGLLHGRMKSDEKDRIMNDFRNNKFQILISTTVIEVGVDIPKATIIMIEGANRFGLSQLHQLRGRVGRSVHQSYCLLIPENEDALENERLQAMLMTSDGFKLAEIDLSQRGPGDFIGTRQSGFKEIRFSTIMNVKLIDKARRLAKEVLENDPEFINVENHLYKIIMAEYWQKMTGENS